MVDYQKLYATLVGRVDDVLQYMEMDFQDPHRMQVAAALLQKALLEAEDAYLDATEGEPPEEEMDKETRMAIWERAQELAAMEEEAEEER